MVKPVPAQPLAKRESWLWKIDVTALVGRNCFVETLEGVLREGKITGTESREMKIKDVLRGVEMVLIPLRIELNGDPSDTIDFMRMHRFELR